MTYQRLAECQGFGSVGMKGGVGRMESLWFEPRCGATGEQWVRYASANLLCNSKVRVSRLNVDVYCLT